MNEQTDPATTVQIIRNLQADCRERNIPESTTRVSVPLATLVALADAYERAVNLRDATLEAASWDERKIGDPSNN